MKPFLLLSTRPEDAASANERDAILRLGGLLDNELVQHRVEAAPLGHVDLDDYAGVFLGGGPFNASDHPKSPLQTRIEADIHAVVDEVVARDFPFLGLCYGVGVLAGRLGGVVDRAYAEPAGVTTARLTHAGRADEIFEGVPDEVTVFVGHKEASRRLPDGAVLLASGSACPVQAFRVGGFIYATQFHPELDRPGFASRIRIYSEEGYFDPADTEALVAFAETAPITDAVHGLLRNFVAIARRREATGRSDAQVG